MGDVAHNYSQQWHPKPKTNLFQADVGEGFLSPSCSVPLTVQKSEGRGFIEHAHASWAPFSCEFTGMVGTFCFHTHLSKELMLAPWMHA